MVAVLLELLSGRPRTIVLIGAIALVIILVVIIWAIYPRRR